MLELKEIHIHDLSWPREEGKVSIKRKIQADSPGMIKDHCNIQECSRYKNQYEQMTDM